MWNEIFKRWIELLFWWVPKDEAKPQEEAKERARSGTQKSAGRESEVVQQEVSDDLTVIRGIGPAIQEKLRALGSRRSATSRGRTRKR
jgi:predicted flap endonuclease-1-like 5' DNA nuclease